MKKQVEKARQQLIQLETANGKVQIPSEPTQGTASVVEKIEAVTEVKPEQEETQKSGQKKEKPKKEKVAEKPPTDVEVMDVGRLDMRVGKIIEVSRHPDADSLYLEKIDCGEEAPRNVVSGLVKHIPIEEMQNRLVVVLCNLKPAKMRGVLSEAMVMCASTPEKVEILEVPSGALPGDLIYCEGFSRNPDLPFMNPKKKVFETIAPDLKVNENLLGTYKGVPLVIEGKGPIKSQTLKNVIIK